MDGDRDQQVLMERIGGATLRELGEAHALSHEAVRLLVIRAGTQQINQLELDLMLATQTGEHPTFLVPFQAQEDWQRALGYFQWCLDSLRRRGVRVKVTTRQTPAGSVFQIEQESDR